MTNTQFAVLVILVVVLFSGGFTFGGSVRAGFLMTVGVLLALYVARTFFHIGV
jgi:hypothetical protein